MIVYKMDILAALKNAGYTTTKLRAEKIFGQKTLTLLRGKNAAVSCRVIDRLCCILRCKPGDILDYIPDAPDVPEDQNA